MLLNDPVHVGQSQPRALADSLGREERLEDPLLHFGRHAAAGIGDAEATYRPGLATPGSGGFIGAAPSTYSSAVQPAPWGIASRAFRHKFKSELLEFARVRMERAEVLAKDVAHGNMFANNGPGQFHRVADQLIGIDVRSLQGPPVAEPEKLSREHRRPWEAFMTSWRS